MGPSGLLLFDKPAGWTSHDAAQFLRTRLPRKTKVGHTGTLDPLATGLLVLLVGDATKRQAEFQKQAKTYTGRIRLGVRTETGDIEGKVLEEKPLPPLTLEAIAQAAGGLTGKQKLAAPSYSAIKHQGKPLYYYARKGLEVPVKEREMEVFRFAIEAWEAPEASFAIDCASGTYVRTLAEALGAILGCGGTVSALRRTKVGPFDVREALDEARARALTGEALAQALRPVPA